MILHRGRTASKGITLPVQLGTFPLSIHSSKRYLVDVQGKPFLPVMESAWSACSMLTQEQMITYLDDRAAKGFTGLQIMAPVKSQTNNTPAYANVYGEVPFSDNNDFSTHNTNFWARFAFFVNAAKQRGIQIYLFPGYLGYLGDGTEGWAPQINAASNTTAKLQAFGQMLATLLSGYGNVTLVLGGDYGDAATVAKQFNIVRGWRIVDPNVLISAHGPRSSNAYTVLSAHLAEIGAYLLNGIYTNDYEEYSASATEYGRVINDLPVPCVDLDNQYDEWQGHTADYTMLAQNVSILSGMRGFMYGNVSICEFGAGFWGSAVGAASVLANKLNTAGALRTQYAAALYRSYSWHLLEPKTDNSLVTTALGSLAGRVAPSRANDGSFAMIWTPNTSAFTVNMTALTPASVRARWWDPTTGLFSDVLGQPFLNISTRVFAALGPRVLVLDAA